MNLRFSRLLLPLLVWLQCLAPLLHAHAGGTVGDGLHLPEFLKVAAGGAEAPTMAEDPRCVARVSIGVGTSLEPRPLDLVPAVPCLAAGFPAAHIPRAPAEKLSSWRELPPRHAPRELPFTGAPPSV